MDIVRSVGIGMAYGRPAVFYKQVRERGTAQQVDFTDSATS
jgi:hypothetical protein